MAGVFNQARLDRRCRKAGWRWGFRGRRGGAAMRPLLPARRHPRASNGGRAAAAGRQGPRRSLRRTCVGVCACGTVGAPVQGPPVAGVGQRGGGGSAGEWTAGRCRYAAPAPCRRRGRGVPERESISDASHAPLGPRRRAAVVALVASIQRRPRRAGRWRTCTRATRRPCTSSPAAACTRHRFCTPR